MKNLIKSRRGIAIEMAIGAMLIMMALSIVLISISGMQHKHAMDDRGDFVKKIEAYEITDYILKNHTDYILANHEADSFVYEINKNDETDDSAAYTVYCEKENLENSNNENSNNENSKSYVYTYTVSSKTTGSVILTLEINTVTDDNANVTTNTIISWRD